MTPNSLFILIHVHCLIKRCLARDREADCREKDVLIRDLKEKIVKFSSFVRYLEIQKADLAHQVKAQVSKISFYYSCFIIANVTYPLKFCMDSILQASELIKRSAEENLNNEHSLKKQEARNSVIVHEDMDTSDSDDSDHEREDPDLDDEWKPEQESERESEQESVIKLNRKRNFKVGKRRSSVVPRRSYEENLDSPSDEAVKPTSTSDVCCTCSKSSSCKTMKCQCRATKGSCGPSCGCSSVKCSNRNADGKQNNSTSILEHSESSQEEQQQVLASRGALLLQNALADKPVEETNDGEGTRTRRKPLSDIGNTTVTFS